MTHFRLSLFKVIFSGVLALGAISVSSQQVRPAFEFVDAPTPFTVAAGQDHRIVILNNTARVLSLSVAVIDDSSQDGAGLSSITELHTPVLVVPAGGAGTVTFKIKSTDALKAQSLMTAYLVAYEKSSNTVIRRVVQLRVPEQGATQEKPKLTSLVSPVTLTVYTNPWSKEREKKLATALPLASVIEAPALNERFAKDRTVARLATTEGNSGLLQYQGAQGPLPSGTTGLLLSFKSDGRPGTFTGTLTSIQNEKKESSTVTVISKHHWVFPVLVIALGLLLYYLMQWYLNVIRKVWGLEEREAEVENSFAKAERTFTEEAQDKDYTRYSIKVDFDKQSKALLTRIRELKFKAFLRLDESGKDYKNVDEGLTELENVARDWGGFAATKLTPLRAALETARPDFSVIPPLGLGDLKEPVVATKAVGLLEGEPELTLGLAKVLAARIVELLPRLSTWGSYHSRARDVWQGLNEIIEGPKFSQRDPYEQSEINAHRTTAFDTWRDLWVEDAFDLAPMEDRLSLLENALARARSSETHAGPAAPSFMAAAGDFGEEESESPSHRISDIAVKRLSLDLFYLVLALSIAIYLGLAANYFKVPFGTVRDYFDVFVYGFATKALVDFVTAGIGKIWPSFPK